MDYNLEFNSLYSQTKIDNKLDFDFDIFVFVYKLWHHRIEKVQFF